MIVMIGGGVGVVHYQQISLALLSAIHVPLSYTQDKQHCRLSKTEELLQRNASLEKDISEAQSKCHAVLLGVLMKHDIRPSTSSQAALDPNDI